MNYTRAVFQGFEDRTKEANLFTTLGRGAINAGLGAAKAVGQGPAARNLVRKGLKTSPNFVRNVGVGTAAAGVGAAGLGAGYLAGR